MLINMHKKAMEMTIQTLVVAVLALVILFVLIGIFTGKIGTYGQQYEKVGKQIFECEGEEGRQCFVKSQGCGSGYTKSILRTCDEGKVCCEPVTKK